MYDIKIIRQKPVILFECNQELEIDETFSGIGIPVVGLSMIRGMIYADKAVNLIISQGCNDKGGNLNYRHINSYQIQQCEAREFNIFGKFVKIEIQNISGSAVNVESFFQALLF